MKPFIKPLSVAAVALGATTFGLGVSTAGAAPTNPPSSVQGTASCEDGALTGTFVVNNGNSSSNSNGQSWAGAHLTFDLGGQGIFHPTSIETTFTFDGVPQGTTAAEKNNQTKGSVTCSISAVQGPFSLEGTVVGFITTNG